MYDNAAPQNVVKAVLLKGSRNPGGLVENLYIKNCKFGKEDALIDFVSNFDGDISSAFPPRFQNIYLENLAAEQSRQ